MVHKDRVFTVAEVATAEELTEKLTKFSWCLCNGFKLGEVLYLNDSFSEDGAQEFAVVWNGLQIESVTFGWCKYEQALEIVKQLAEAAEFGLFDIYCKAKNRIEDSSQHGRCHLCA